jgi:hypothetical protein
MSDQRIDGRKKFYITGGHRLDPTQNDTNVSPLVSYGRDRVDALTSAGLTVWSEEEWLEAETKIHWLKRYFPHLLP